VTETTDAIRRDRYAILRSVFRGHDASLLEQQHSHRQQLRNVVLPPGAYAVERSIRDLGLHDGGTVVTAIRREGIIGRDPAPDTLLREGDVLVLWGTPEDLANVESRLLMG
jgi:CPA2 family monovalent cation:H+ antiporter-2